jgi:hypothetical protein
LIAAAVEAHAKPEPDTIHWLALFVPDGAGVKTKVMAIAGTKPDKALVEYNYAQALVPRSSTSTLVALLAQPAALAKQLASDPATTVFGTSENDRGLGAASAKKLVGSWSKLVLEVVDTPEADRKHDYEPLEVKVGDATAAWARLRMKLPGHKSWIPVDVFAIARKTSSGDEIVAIAYDAD